jgi:hypothetical protein
MAFTHLRLGELHQNLMFRKMSLYSWVICVSTEKRVPFRGSESLFNINSYYEHYASKWTVSQKSGSVSHLR